MDGLEHSVVDPDWHHCEDEDDDVPEDEEGLGRNKVWEEGLGD